MRAGIPRMPNLNDLVDFARLLEIRTVSRWVGLGLIVGVGAGLGAAGFFVAMDYIRYLVFTVVARLHLLEPGGEHSLFAAVAHGDPIIWLVVLAPALGGLLSGLIVFRFAPEAEGHGTDALIDSFHNKRGAIRKRIPIVKAVASVILLGTGGSAGREGPIAQIGAGFGSVLATTMRLTPRERRLLLLAGAAGGIGAIFRTPLGAALFIVEVLYRDDFEVDALVPTVLASVVSYSVFTMIFGEGNIFTTQAHYEFNPLQLPLYLVMAIFASVIGVLYIKVFYGMRDRVFVPLPIPRALKPMIGGLLVGLLYLVAPQSLGAGYGWLQEVLRPTSEYFPLGWQSAALLLFIALLKVLTTSLSISSGGSGGVFGPSVVIGGMIGGAFGMAFHLLVPQIAPQPGAFAIVGMACFFGGVAHAPISSLVMASEMTGSYDLLVPIMLAEAVAFVMLRRWTLYERQVPTRRDSAAHGTEFVLDVLQHVRVEEAVQLTPPRSLVPSTPLAEVLRQASECTQAIFPVVDAEGCPRGIVSLDTIRAFFYDQELGQLAIAADCSVPLVSVATDDTLDAALRRVAKSGLPQVPVVDPDDEHKIVGLLSYEEILAAYSRELMRRRDEAGAAA
jgi:CIC family chloride channel protein